MSMRRFLALNNLSLIILVSAGFFVLTFLLAGVNVAYGHGSGLTMQKNVGNYIVDVDVDAPILQAGMQERFTFNITNVKDIALLPEFTDAWVRIAPKDGFGTIFASDLHKPEFGGIGMTYVFSKGGEYDLTVRFEKDGEKIAEEVIFPLTVEDDPNVQSKSIPREFFIGLFLGVLLAGIPLFFLRKK